MKRFNQHGFTIVELLIVVVVIAILAAISLVSYNGIQKRATQASSLAELNNFGKQLQLYQSNSYKETFPRDAIELESVGLKANKSIYSKDINSLAYCLINPGLPNQRMAIGMFNTAGEPIYIDSADGLKAKLYTGVLTPTTQMNDICKSVFGQDPYFYSRGVVDGVWQPWAHAS